MYPCVHVISQNIIATVYKTYAREERRPTCIRTRLKASYMTMSYTCIRTRLIASYMCMTFMYTYYYALEWPCSYLAAKPTYRQTSLSPLLTKVCPNYIYHEPFFNGKSCCLNQHTCTMSHFQRGAVQLTHSPAWRSWSTVLVYRHSHTGQGRWGSRAWWTDLCLRRAPRGSYLWYRGSTLSHSRADDAAGYRRTQTIVWWAETGTPE